MTEDELDQYTALSFAQGAARMILDDTIERFPGDKEVRGALARLETACVNAKLRYPDPLPEETSAGRTKMERFFEKAGWGGVNGKAEQRRHPQTYLAFVAAILSDEVRRSMKARASTRPNGREKRMLKAEAEAGAAALLFPENNFCIKAATRAAEIWGAISKAAQSGEN